MKEGWEYKKLGEIATEMYRGSGIKRDQVTKEGTPCVRYGEIYTTYNISFDTCASHTKIENVTSPKYFEYGDLLFAITGESVEDIGKTIAYLGDEKCLCGGDIICMKHHQNPKYLAYALSTPDAIRQKGIGKTKLKVVHTNAPALKAISIAFAKIDAMKANAEKALNEAKALFQASLKEMLEPKKGWEESELKDIVDEKCPISYGIVQQGDHVEGGIPVVRPVDLNRKYITANGLKCTTESISSSYKRTILRGDEILLGVRGTTGIIGIATEELNGCNVNRGVVPLFFKDTICRDFIFYEMLSPAIQAVFAEKTTGATLKQINIKDLRTIVFSYPIIEIQQSIVETLDSLKSKVDRLQENFDKISKECDALKQAILRQVFE